MWVGIFDQTALIALGAGNWRLSWFVTRAHGDGSFRLYTPALCLTAASAARAGLGEHILQLPAMEVTDLGVDAVEVGQLIAGGIDWRAAHAVVCARPNAEWPSGRPVLTSHPDPYGRRGIETVVF